MNNNEFLDNKSKAYSAESSMTYAFETLLRLENEFNEILSIAGIKKCLSSATIDHMHEIVNIIRSGRMECSCALVDFKRDWQEGYNKWSKTLEKEEAARMNHNND